MKELHTIGFESGEGPCDIERGLWKATYLRSSDIYGYYHAPHEKNAEVFFRVRDELKTTKEINRENE